MQVPNVNVTNKGFQAKGEQNAARLPVAPPKLNLGEERSFDHSATVGAGPDLAGLVMSALGVEKSSS